MCDFLGKLYNNNTHHFRPFSTKSLDSIFIKSPKKLIFGLFGAILGTFSPIWAQTRFFREMRFSQNVRGPLDLSFSAKKSIHQWLRFSSKLEKPHFRAILGHFGPKFPNLGQTRFFPKNRALSLFYVYGPLTSQKKSDKTHDPISLTLRYGRTDGLMYGRQFIELFR